MIEDLRNILDIMVGGVVENFDFVMIVGGFLDEFDDYVGRGFFWSVGLEVESIR